MKDIQTSEQFCPIEDTKIFTGKLHSGQPYQRPVEEKDVRKLMAKWDRRLMDSVTVNYRDGKYYLVDGQHRVSILRRLNGGKDVMVPCKLYHGLTYEQEAELCYKLDQAKHRLKLSQSTKALLESQTDAEVIDIRRLVEANGFKWALGKRNPVEYEITAARAVFNVYRQLGAAAFDRMLHLMAGAWHGAPCTLQGSFLTGMALFLKTYETELVDRTAVRRLANIDPEEVLRRGKTDFSTNHAALRYARVLLKKYNSQPGGHKLSYRFKE